MKCYICGHEIPEGKKYCPGCGRVLSQKDKDMVARESETVKTEPPVTAPVKDIDNLDKTAVYRPAAAKSAPTPEKTIHIPDIFSKDPNAPEYEDPHTYDRATADVLEYDRMFLNKGSDNNDDDYVRVAQEDIFAQKKADEEVYSDNGYFDEAEPSYTVEQENEDDAENGAVIRDKKYAKPHFNLNRKVLVVCIAVILGIAICVMGVYQIGKQIGFWGSSEQASIASEDSSEKEEATSKKSDTTTEPSAGTTIGTYTVTSKEKNIFMFKDSKGQTLIATIPTNTVIYVTELNGDYGLTTYKTKSGWVKLSDITYTPGATASQTTTESSSGASEYPDTPGNYTVDVDGDGDSVNVRSENSTNGIVVTTLKDGTAVTVDEVQSGWGHISVDGFEGWVYMRYLK